jgi:hypothetical protein
MEMSNVTMKRISLSEIAHGIIRESIQAGDVAIDATLGNGHDTLFLAQCVGESGHVYGFDVQHQALQASQQRLMQHDLLARATLIHACHAQMIQHTPAKLHGQIKAIMFNLGYLPGADKHIITKTSSTLLAMNAACLLLAEQGVLTVMAYPGHVGGDEETLSLEQWLQQLDADCFQTQIIFSHHHQTTAPKLFVIRKLA